ncbi:MAG TPA: hypothetical protein EYP85_06200 [Armatimonadetes bacterium]|nr:hypothetical protein [Armatimonadota bacterium]
MTIGEVLSVPEVPTVVQLAQVEALKEQLDALPSGVLPEGELEAQLRGYVEQYYLVDERTRDVVQTILTSLATSRDRGGAFFVKGLYGSGKSHLLAVLSLLSEHPVAWEYFLRTHVEFAACADRFLGEKPLLVVHVALDEYSGRYTDLEDIVFDEAERSLRRPRLNIFAPLTEEAYALDLLDRYLVPPYGRELEEFLRTELGLTTSWAELRESHPEAALSHARRFIVARGLPLDFRQSRVERLGRLLEIVQERGLRGVVLLVDELSVFLSTKSRQALQNEASFLQFLGQRARLSPLWVVATLQKNLEDVGDIEHYTLRQIKDRFHTRLSLPLTEVRKVVAEKLLVKSNRRAYAEAVQAAHRAWTGGRRVRGLSREALTQTYPLHPLTLDCLEACAEEFLSKTRSVLDFVLAQVRGDETHPGVLAAPVTHLITPDVLYDHFAPEIAGHPTLSRYQRKVYEYYRRNCDLLFAEEGHLALRLVKLLIIYRLAALERPVREIAAALLPAEEGREARVQRLLEIMRTEGSYVDVRRRPGEFNDRYVVDLDFEVNEIIRRRVRSLEANLAPEDGRMLAYALSVCTGKEFPLAAYQRPTVASVPWLNTVRTMLLSGRDLTTLSSEELTNQTALLAGLDTEEAVSLYLASPFHLAEQRAAWEEAVAAVPDQRWAQALVAWLPRPLTEEEQEQLRTDTAHELLRQDPTLQDHQQGERILARLEEGREGREARTRELMQRLYYEGELRSPAGLISAAELSPLQGRWTETLARVGRLCFDRLFPRFRAYAPRRRVFSRACANELINDFVAQGRVEVSLASTLAAYILDYAVPLGVAEGENGRFRVRVAGTPLVKFLLQRLPPHVEREVSLLELEQVLAKSEFGLVPELTHILVAALIRRGFLTALNDEREPLPVHRLGAPLRAHVAFVTGADALPPEAWPRLKRLCEVLWGRAPQRETLTVQQAVWERLLALREEWQAEGERLSRTLTEVRQTLGHDEIQWLRAAEVFEFLQGLIAALDPEALAAPGLTRLVEVISQPPFVDEEGTDQPLVRAWERYQQLRTFVQEQAEPLLRLYRDLNDPRLNLPADSDLATRREELQRRFAAGDAVAWEGEPLLADAQALRDEYVERYLAWHHQVYAPARFERYLQVKMQPAYRLLTQMARLRLDVARGPETVDALVRQELSRRCRVFDLRPRLQQSLVCPECGLLYGQPLPLRPVEEIESELLAGVQDYLLTLREPERAELLRRAAEQLPETSAVRQQVTAILTATDATVKDLLRWFDPPTVEFLNSVLETRAVATRRLSELAAALVGKRLTKQQILAAVQRWLDTAEALGPEEVVEIVE